MPTSPPYLDPRGQRFAAAATSVLLAASLLTTGSPPGPILLAVQAAIFVVGAADIGRHPYGLVFKRWVRPRLAPPAELEAAASPRFAQALGAAFALAGLLAYLVGAPVVAAVATGMALVAALLNAVFAVCLGCELHLLVVRALGRPIGPRTIRTSAG